jgi:hypothetical protein
LNTHRVGHFRFARSVRIPGDLSIYGPKHGPLDRVYYPLLYLIEKF